ncbi:MAG TPA: hypothetical protein VFF52_02265 [Isosphaeraceae bacterium]|nr:hypothetical protein [Isosphaeraceae bacterium]
MTSPERQDLLRALGELSEAFPEWRFGQMIANLAVVARGATTEAIWDVEDDERHAAIQRHLEQRRATVSNPG